MKILKFYENFEFLKKIEILRKNHIALSCHVISFIDFARECNMIIYCTEIAFS
jgi:hypothetical protein